MTGRWPPHLQHQFKEIKHWTKMWADIISSICTVTQKIKNVNKTQVQIQLDLKFSSSKYISGKCYRRYEINLSWFSVRSGLTRCWTTVFLQPSIFSFLCLILHDFTLSFSYSSLTLWCYPWLYFTLQSLASSPIPLCTLFLSFSLLSLSFYLFLSLKWVQQGGEY